MADYQKSFDIEGLVNSILKWHLSLEEAATKYHLEKEEVLNYINSYKEPEKTKVLEIIARRKENPDLKLYNLPAKVQEEIDLMILTYRVNPYDLVSLFKTNIDDVEMFISNQKSNFFTEPLFYLINETSTYNARERKYALENAQNYWKMRNRLIRKLNEAEKENIKEYLQEKLKEHRKLIDDSYIKESNGKDYRLVTEEEKNAIARFRVKYGIFGVEEMTVYGHNNHVKETLSIIERSPDYIRKLENELASRDAYFNKSLEYLKNAEEKASKDFLRKSH